MLKIEKLLIQGPERNNSRFICFVSNFAELQEKSQGKLVLLIEFSPYLEEDRETMEMISESVKDYYNDDYSRSREEKKFFDVETAFENALQKTNLKLQKRLSETGRESALERLNALAAVIKGSRACFSQFGRCHILLVRKNKSVEIVSEAKSGKKHGDSEKIFSHISSGYIEDNDRLIFYTDSILNYLPLEKLKEISVSYSPRRIGQYMRDMTMGDTKAALAAIILDNPAMPAMEMPSHVAHDHSHGITKPERKKPKFKSAVKTAAKYLKHALSALKKAVLVLGRLIGKAASSAKKSPPKEPVASFAKKIPKKADSLASAGIGQFNKLTYQSKVLLIISLIFAILFAQSTFLLIKKHETEKTDQRYMELSQQIEKLQNDGLASLIYGDEGKAKESLEQAEILLRDFPQDTAQQQENYGLLIQENTVQLNRLRHVNSIDDPVVFADLGQENGASLGGILETSKNIYAFGAGSFYKIGLEDHNVSAVAYSGNGGLKYGTPSDDSSVLFFKDNGQLAKYEEKSGTFSSVALSPEKSPESIGAMAVYGKNIYFLNSTGNQILKYSPADSGFGGGTPWIKENEADVTGGVSLAIDSAIYVLKSDGEIIKLYQGARQDFSASGVEPALSSPTKIFTAYGIKYIYVLEPAGKRVVVIDKQGKMVGQYYSEKFDDLKDLVVSGKEDRAYLLNGSKIFEISLK